MKLRTPSAFATMVAAAAFLVAGCGGDGDSTTGPEPGPDPSISNVEPATGTVGTEVKIVGANFRSGATVLFGTLEADSVDVVADTLAFALAPSGMSAGELFDLTIRNSDDTEDTLAEAFEAVAPELLFANGASKPSGQEGSTVVLDGDAFGDLHADDGTVLGRVLFSDGAGGTVEATIANEEDWTNTFILTTVPSGAGSGDLVVETQTGTSAPLEFTVTSGATFSPSQVDWNQTTNLPTGVSGHEAVYVPIDVGTGIDRYVHVTGGTSNDSVPREATHFAVINADGTLGSWTSGSSLTAGRAFHASAAATPFNSRVKGDGWLYVLGGIEAKSGDPVSGVLRAEIMSDGSLGAWESAGNLPEELHSHDAVIFRSNLYVSGGARTGHEPRGKVYRARIDSLGQLGSWNTLQDLPTARAYHEMTVIGNCLHVYDGNTAAVVPETDDLTDTRLLEIDHAKVDLRSSDLTDAGWTIDGTSPPKARYKATALIAGGVVLRTAGLYNGIGTSGSSENNYAQIASDCDVGDFSGANNAASIKSKGGANLFNHGAVSYVDADGVAHVMILGGDDVDAPGNKRAEVWFF